MKLLRTILAITLSLSIISCGKYRSVIVHGKPGTTIHYADKTYLGTIGSNGTTKIKLDNDAAFQAFLLSKGANSNEYHPFATEYKRNNKKGWLVGSMIITLPLGYLGGYLIEVFYRNSNYYFFKYLKHQTINEDLIPNAK